MSNGNHFKEVCRCGKTVNQCRCPSVTKEVRISTKPCDECKEKADISALPIHPPAPTSKELTKENYKHIDEVVARYNFTCQTCKELEIKIAVAESHVKDLKDKTKKASMAMESLMEKVTVAYREKEKIGRELLEAAGQ